MQQKKPLTQFSKVFRRAHQLQPQRSPLAIVRVFQNQLRRIDHAALSYFLLVLVKIGMPWHSGLVVNLCIFMFSPQAQPRWASQAHQGQQQRSTSRVERCFMFLLLDVAFGSSFECCDATLEGWDVQIGVSKSTCMSSFYREWIFGQMEPVEPLYVLRRPIHIPQAFLTLDISGYTLFRLPNDFSGGAEGLPWGPTCSDNGRSQEAADKGVASRVGDFRQASSSLISWCWSLGWATKIMNTVQGCSRNQRIRKSSYVGDFDLKALSTILDKQVKLLVDSGADIAHQWCQAERRAVQDAQRKVSTGEQRMSDTNDSDRKRPQGQYVCLGAK